MKHWPVYSFIYSCFLFQFSLTSEVTCVFLHDCLVPDLSHLWSNCKASVLALGNFGCFFSAIIVQLVHVSFCNRSARTCWRVWSHTTCKRSQVDCLCIGGIVGRRAGGPSNPLFWAEWNVQWTYPGPHRFHIAWVTCFPHHFPFKSKQCVRYLNSVASALFITQLVLNCFGMTTQSQAVFKIVHSLTHYSLCSVCYKVNYIGNDRSGCVQHHVNKHSTQEYSIEMFEGCVSW